MPLREMVFPDGALNVLVQIIGAVMIHRALVFDDNSLVRFSLTMFFGGRGYEVFTFSRPEMCRLDLGRKCSCPAETSCTDLIISDLNMPEVNGIDFIERLIGKGCKQRHFGLMSDDFSSTDLVRAAHLPCTLFRKPLDLQKVKEWADEVERSIPLQRILLDWT